MFIKIFINGFQKIGSTVPTQCKLNVVRVISLKFGGKSPKLAEVWTLRTLAFCMLTSWSIYYINLQVLGLPSPIPLTLFHPQLDVLRLSYPTLLQRPLVRSQPYVKLSKFQEYFREHFFQKSIDMKTPYLASVGGILPCSTPVTSFSSMANLFKENVLQPQSQLVSR